MSVSAGYISNVINEASVRAQSFDDQVDLSGIIQGANDEIFQCGSPVLVGMDPESTYTYLLEEASDRSAETWETYLEDRKDRGLALEVSINDGGTGLMAGIPKAFPNAEIQTDTFHTLYTMGKEISKIERKAYSLIKGEQALEENLSGKRPRKKNEIALEEIKPKTTEAINTYDTLYILFCWFKEMLGFAGYGIEDSRMLCLYILQEMEKVSANHTGLLKEITKARKHLHSLLLFVRRLERGMAVCSNKTGIPVEAFQLMYRQLSYSPSSVQSNEAQIDLVHILKEKYTEARAQFQNLLNTVKKASSMVENLNGRIRVYMEVKRVVPTRFFVLMKVYFNTRRYKRSRRNERIGRSPLELLTGTPQPDFFQALGY
jgi:hypothetical protein